MTRADLIKELGSGDYSERFKGFMPFIFDAENVYSRKDGKTIIIERVRGDTGGTTFAGIDKASHPHFDFNNITPQSVCSVYYGEWGRENIETFNYPFGECYFDCCVNAGASRAERIKQKTGSVAGAFLDEREAFYQRLAEAKPADRKFLQGWKNRISDLRKFLKI